MEHFAALLVPALMGMLVLRLIFAPMKWGLRLALYLGSGFLCLWLVNAISGFTGVYIPINAITAAVSGFLGLPGVSLLALLEML